MLSTAIAYAENMSMDEIRAGLSPEDVLRISRLEEDNEVKKITVFHGNQEIPGVTLNEQWVSSFALLFSVLAEILPTFDVPLLQRDYPQHLWMSAAEVSEVVAHALSDTTEEESKLALVEIVNFIPHKGLQADVRKSLQEDRSVIFEVLNGSNLPGTKKPVLGTFWFWVAMAKWAATKKRKTLAYAIAVTDHLDPVGSKVSAKILESWVSKLKDKLKSNIQLQAPRPPQPVDQAPAVAVGAAASASDPAKVSVADAAASHSMAEVIRQTSELMRDIPAEHLSKAVKYLNNLLGPYSSTHKLTTHILRLEEAAQVAAYLEGYPWPTSTEAKGVKQSLMAWQKYVTETHLVQLTVSVKQKHLKECLEVLLSSQVKDWKKLALDIGVRLLAVESEDLPLFDVSRITSPESCVHAVTKFIGQSKTTTEAKGLVQVIKDSLAQSDPENWASNVVSQFMSKLNRPQTTPLSSSATHQSNGDRVGVRVSVEGSGSTTVPWIVLTSVAVATFGAETLLPKNIQARGLETGSIVIGVLSEVWEAKSCGCDPFAAPIGYDSSIVFTTRSKEGNPITLQMSGVEQYQSVLKSWSETMQSVRAKWSSGPPAKYQKGGKGKGWNGKSQGGSEEYPNWRSQSAPPTWYAPPDPYLPPSQSQPREPPMYGEYGRGRSDRSPSRASRASSPGARSDSVRSIRSPSLPGFRGPHGI